MVIDIQAIIFYQFAALLLVASTMVVVSKNPVKSVLSLVLAFFASAVLWMIQQAEFLSLALIFVYVGAVMTLFLFIVLMLNVSALPQRARILGFTPALFALLVAFAYSFYQVFVQGETASITLKDAPNPTLMLGSAENIAHVLYTDYVIVFELVAVVLLIAIVAAIALTQRAGRVGVLRQRVGDQVAVNPETRVTLVKMEAESS